MNMKTYIILFLFCLSFFLPNKMSGQTYNVQNVRSESVINREWTFNYLPSGKEDVTVSEQAYDDSKWQAIALPHTWSTYETTKDVHPYMMYASEREDSYWWNGWGYYRKRIVLGEELLGKKIFVEFEGVQKYSKVYCNGILLGEHKGGYNGFYFDLTPHVKLGEENLLTVAVSNRRDDKFGTIAPATAGNFNVYGGIYRNVRIVVKNDIYIPFQGSYKHEGGTFVTTPQVNHDHATVNIKTYVKNDQAQSKNIELRSIITDADDNIIEILKSKATINAEEIHEIEQKSKTISKPKLWSFKSPYLYKVYTEVLSDGKLCDTYTSPLGFRWFEWDYSDNKLIVNGEKIHIHGTNRHQEYPWVGDAMPHWMTERDMMDIRFGMNSNFMRTAHYPHDPLVYRFNDKHGIITVIEAPNIKPINFNRKTQEENMREMVRSFRNNPSVFFWSVGNETSNAGDSKWVYEEDTTRIIHERKTENYGDYVTHHASNLDMENLLRVTIRGWYNKDVKDLEPANSPGVDKSGQYAGTEEWQHKMARVDNGNIRGRIDWDVVGWLYEDHGCDRIYKDSPLQNINYKGWVDLYRIPKYMYYLWQANYLPEPMIHIQPHHWREKYLGEKKNVQVDSNCDKVELFVNNKKVGEQYPSKNNFFTVEFTNISIVDGSLKAIGTRGKETIETTLTMAGKPAQIILTAERGEIAADRSGMDIITADVVDAKGNRVVGFSEPLTWEVLGEGTLVGHNIYHSDIDKTLSMEGSGYVVTPVPNVVRATNKAGVITVKVSSPGLRTGEIKIKSIDVDRNQSINIKEPILSDIGRATSIVKDKKFREVAEYIQELQYTFNPSRISASNLEEYEKAMWDYVTERNPGIDTLSIEFGVLIKRLGSYLQGTSGEMTEDDYNFIAKTYNDLRLLSRTIENRNFHPNYTDELVRNYSGRMLTDNKIVDVEAAQKMINEIPQEIDVIFVRNPQRSSQILPIVYGNTTYRYSAVANSIEETLELLHPEEYKKLSDTEKKRLLDYIVKINPAVTKTEEGIKIKFDKPIAIPRNIKM